MISTKGLSSIFNKNMGAKIVKPVKPKPNTLMQNLKMRYGSKTTNNARVAKMKAQDPVGMLKYNRKINTSSPVTRNLIDKNYQRRLYAPF